MREHITHVAFDMHRDSITAAWVLPSESSPALRTIPHEVKPFRRLVRQILAHGPACACYEAGPLGYAPQRQLRAWGLPCEVIAPSLTPRRRRWWMSVLWAGPDWEDAPQKSYRNRPCESTGNPGQRKACSVVVLEN